MPEFREIAPETIADNVFKLIDKDWMLITAGREDNWNTMTASWGGLGILWHRPIGVCFVRPTRYTFEFLNQAAQFTLSFFDEQYREALMLCGTKSGREVDKAKATGLKPLSDAPGVVYFEQARLVLQCRKLYWQDFDPANFVEPAIEEEYPNKDYHRVYVGEVVRCLVK